MRIARVDSAISVCKTHITVTNSKGTEIEFYLTQYLLVLVYACFEMEVDNILNKRAEQITDTHVKAFLQTCISRNFNSIKVTDLSGFLGHFGADYKKTFQDKIQAAPTTVTFYSNIISNRHEVAHNSGSALTFDDLVEYYEQGHVILDYFSEAIGNQMP